MTTIPEARPDARPDAMTGRPPDSAWRRARSSVVVALLTLGAVAAMRGALLAIGASIRFLSNLFEPLVLLGAAAAMLGALVAIQIVAFGVKRLRTGIAPVLIALLGGAAIIVPRYLASVEPTYSYELHGVLTGAASSTFPEFSAWRKKQLYRNNRYGLRGADFDETKRPGVLRVALVGDSFVYGLGVAENETLKSFLDEELRARGLGDRVEVLNLGVAGTNLPTHIQMYDLARRHLGADVVVIGLFLWNDLSTWDWQDETGGSARLGGYSLLRYLVGGDGATALVTSLFVQHGFHFISLRNLDRLLPRLSAARDPEATAPPLVVLAYGRAPPVRARFEALPGTLYLEAPEDEAYYLPRDRHPSAEGNRAFAKRLIAPLLERLPLGPAKPPSLEECGEHETRIGCLRLVAGGTFAMGAQRTDPNARNYDPDAQPDEGPVHDVTVSPFFMTHAEVSAGLFYDCVLARACAEKDARTGGYGNFKVPGRHLHPMNAVSWNGARDYCRYIGGRLPTEAEWEWAARGTRARRFPWGDEPATCDRAVMRDARGAGGCGDDGTRSVKAGVGPAANLQPGGFAHLAGNVWEWTADFYDPGYYARSPSRDPRGPEAAARRVQRGGAWTSEAGELRAAYRASAEPDDTADDVGFRCVAEPSAVAPAPPENSHP